MFTKKKKKTVPHNKHLSQNFKVTDPAEKSSIRKLPAGQCIIRITMCFWTVNALPALLPLHVADPAMSHFCDASKEPGSAQMFSAFCYHQLPF